MSKFGGAPSSISGMMHSSQPANPAIPSGQGGMRLGSGIGGFGRSFAGGATVPGCIGRSGPSALGGASGSALGGGASGLSGIGGIGGIRSGGALGAMGGIRPGNSMLGSSMGGRGVPAGRSNMMMGGPTGTP